MRAPVRTRSDVLARLHEAEEEIRGLGVRRLALFGSFARPEPGLESGVDLLVEFAPQQKSFDRFMQLCDLLEERLARRVEVVTTEALSPFIGPHIWPRRRMSFESRDYVRRQAHFAVVPLANFGAL